MALQSINPSSGILLNSYPKHSKDQIFSILQKAQTSAAYWRATNIKDRAILFSKCHDLLLERKHEYAELISIEMGKPIKESILEIEKCALVCTYYAEAAEEQLKPKTIASDASESFVSYEPLGTVLGIMPWNFPFWQVFRFAVPALMAGNTAVLKHASNVSGCALLLESIFAESGFPAGVFCTLIITPGEIEDVIKSPAIQAVTLTGSEYAGSSVAAIAGKSIKKTVLELGGSDSFIVFNDADCDLAAEMAVKSRFFNNGQSCISAKRFIVQSQIYNQFLAAVKEKVSNLTIGNPLDDQTDIGPMARKDLADNLKIQLEKALEEGAVLAYEYSYLPAENGYYFKPVIIENVKKGMSVFQEETFGPLMAIAKFDIEEEAIELANDSKYGLGASVWTKDYIRGKRMAGLIESGSVFINGMVKSDPRLPFGGIKISGYGRELSHFGIREFVNIKTVWIR